MDLDKLLQKRHSTRRFKETKKPDYRDILTAIESATKTPLAGNIASLKYILVSNKDTIRELAQAAQQKFVGEVSYIVVVCSDKSRLVKSYYKRGEIYARHQAGASIENFLLKITELNLATCWVGAFDDLTVKRILKIPENIDVEALLPVGFEFEKVKPRKKPDLDNVMYFDKWKQKEMKPYKGLQT